MITLVVFLGFITVVVAVASVFTASVIAAFLGGMLAVIGVLVKMKPDVLNPSLLQEVQCRQVAMAPELAQSHSIIASLLQGYLSQSTPRIKAWQNQEDGSFTELYNRRAKSLNSRELENAKETYNIAMLDLSRVKATNQRFAFSGPVFVYSSQTEDLEELMMSVQGLRVTSRTAVIFCNESLPNARLIFDTPTIVISRAIDRDVMLMNVSTPGHPTLKIDYKDVLEKVVGLLQSVASGALDGKSMNSERIEVILSDLKRGMPKSSAPPRPIDVSYQQFDRSSDTGTKADLWKQTECRFSWGVKCQLTLTRDMLQHFAVEALAKEGGGAKMVPIHAGPVNGTALISDPHVYLKDGRVGVEVDVEIYRQTNTQTSTGKIAGLMGAVLPEKFTLQNVKIDGKLRYDDDKGEIFFQDPEIVSFQVEPRLQSKLRPYEVAIKSALNQVLKPVMETKPVYEFRKQSGAVGMFGKYVLESIETRGSETLIANLKLL